MIEASEARRRDGGYLVLLGSVIFLLLGFAFEYAIDHPISDFRFVYNGVRCLLQGVDPYQRSGFIRVFEVDGGHFGTGKFSGQYMEMAQHMYPPTSAIVLPFALLPWTWSLTAWSITIAMAFLGAAFLMWKAGADRAPLLTGGLVCLIVGLNETLLEVGNAAGLVVSLCVIAVWCFVQERFAAVGVACLSVALMLKPHDAGLIWLFFLLAGGTYRKRAWQTLAVALALSAPLVMWTTIVAPHWLAELRANLTALSVHGGLNDPGPDSMAGHGLAMAVSLQTVFSVVHDEPKFYNLMSYAVCAVLILIWGAVTVRMRPTGRRAWLALAAIAAISMLPVYHRMADTKLLLLTIPACAMLWAEGGVLAWGALIINGLGLLLTCDFTWALFLALFGSLPSWMNSGFAGLALQTMPVPLILLVLGAFYLSVYARDSIRGQS
jgi:hypothetical protein